MPLNVLTQCQELATNMASNNNSEPRSWQVGKSLADCLRHMLDNHVACDVTFSVQSTGNPHVKIPAHKLILQARSPVFEAMLSGAFLEASGDVVIMDMDPEPFKDLLRYIYTDDVTLNGDNVMPLLYAAKKYILENLVDKCKEFLEKEISVDNVCSVLTQSLIQQDEELVNKCLDLIAPNVKAVVKTESFYTMSHDALLKVVGYDHLAHGVEAELFEACIEWGKHRTKDPDKAAGEEIRDILGTACLHKIRFPYIPLDDFGAKFGNTSVLTSDEKCVIYSMLVTHEKSYCKILSDLGFDISSRMYKLKRYKHCSQNMYGEPLLSDNSKEKFTFSVDKPILLRGFSIHGGKKGVEHDVEIILHSVEGKIKQPDPIAHVKQKITPSEYCQPIPVFLRKILLSVNAEYQVCVSVTGMDRNTYSWTPIEKIEEGCFTISSKFLQHPLIIIGDEENDENDEAAGFAAEFLCQRFPAVDQ